ncbi:MAG: glycoside hydrolase [Candidatus Dormibacteraeota bacterium]|nr:glycoside hydrolase [Candidatus Dormibacteraeota bacterium]
MPRRWRRIHRWSNPITVQAEDGNQHDVNFLTADLADTKIAYITYPRKDANGSAKLVLARTSDSGVTWSTPQVVYQAPPGAYAFAGRVFRLPGGTIVEVFLEIPGSQECSIRAVRSTDNGHSWSAPTTIGTEPGWADPCGTAPTGSTSYLWSLPSAAQAPDGRIYVAWTKNTTDRPASLVVAGSIDGATWSVLPGAVGVTTTRNGLPTLAVSAAGTLGLMYYQMEQTSDGSHRANVWLAQSRDRGTTWQEKVLAGPFDPSVPKLEVIMEGSIADYAGIAPLGADGFAAAFEMTTPQAANGPDDIFFEAVFPGTRPSSTPSSRPTRPADVLKLLPNTSASNDAPASPGRASAALGLAALILAGVVASRGRTRRRRSRRRGRP